MSDSDPNAEIPTVQDQDQPQEMNADGSAVPFGEAETEVAPASLEERIAGLEAALAHAGKERLLALAEAANAGKRADKRISDNAKYATSNICKAILQVADNLERALLAAPEKLRAQNDLVKNLAVGVEMTGKELTAVLESQGVSKFPSLDQPYDANLHQAMQEIENPDVPAGTIVQVVQDGYMMADRLLRPAMVVIAKGGPKREVTAPEAPGESSGIDTSV